MPDYHPRPAGRRYGAAGRDARREPRPPRREHRRDQCRRGRSADPAAGRIHRRSGRVREAVEHPQGVVPVDRRNAGDRHDGDHRGRRLPDREPRARHRPTAGVAGRVRLPRGDLVRPRPRRQSALRLHPGFRQRQRGRSLSPLHGRGLRDGRRPLRRLAEGGARDWPQHGAFRRAGVGRAGLRTHARDQAHLRSHWSAEPWRHPQRRSASPPEEPEAVAGGRRDRR